MSDYDDWTREYDTERDHESYTTDETERCDWCGEPVTEDEPGMPCDGRDGPIHAKCHWETGCTRRECE